VAYLATRTLKIAASSKAATMRPLEMGSALTAR